MDQEPLHAQRLLFGRLHDPYLVLGPHRDDEDFVYRALVVEAEHVRLEGTKEREFDMQRVGDSPLFEWRGKPKKIPPHPELRWLDRHGHEHRRRDAYSFRPVVPGAAVERFSSGTSLDAYTFMGAHPGAVDDIAGVRFAVWAPNAAGVSVVGDFNDWQPRAHPMACAGDSGIWVLFVPDIAPPALYKFEINDGNHAFLKADPFAFTAEHRPRTASIVTGESTFAWTDADWLEARSRADWLHQPMNVYEVHAGSWRHDEHGPLGYRRLADELVAYASGLGFTHIELLPLAEHPLDDSWGYQTTGYYAPTSRYGTPDDLRYLVDRCHAHGLGVFLDWTPAHFPKDAHGLALFDGTFLYEHANAKQREHPDWNTLVFNYGRNEVRSFLTSNAAFWLSEFHFDGLRVDAVASMLYLDYSRKHGEWEPNEYGGNENLAAIAFLKQLNVELHREFPGVVIMAEESTAWPMVSRPVYLGGLGFSMKWNMGWMHDSLEYITKDPVHRRYHHDGLTFPLVYAFSENFLLPYSHDEVVHGKRSMLSKMPGDRWQQFANLRLLYCYQYAMPGRKLTFMGNELAAPTEWNFREQLPWWLLEDPAHLGVQRLVADLNALVRSESAMYAHDFDPSGFRWIDCHDSQNSVLSFMRFDGERFVVCLFNFTPVVRRGYRVGVPVGCRYRELVNSDSTHYGGSNVGNSGTLAADTQPWMGQPASLLVTLPPLAAVFLAPDVAPGSSA